jgi:hypothetical protein
MLIFMHLAPVGSAGGDAGCAKGDSIAPPLLKPPTAMPEQP